MDALRVAREWGDFGSIVIGSKRAMNILKGYSSKNDVRPSLFNAPEEQSLYQSFLEAKERIGLHLKQKAYEAALLEMTKMRQPIDDFFDGVMVMVEDEPLRNNRLALLDSIGQLFQRIADFSKLT